MSFTEMARAVNGTILDSEDAKTKVFLYDTQDKVFKIALLSVALCVLTVTGIMMCVSYYNHRRRNKRPYASAAPEELGVYKVRRGTRQFSNLFGDQEELIDNSHIYYIFSNTILVEDETDPHKPSVCTPLTLEEYAKDPKNRITLNPPVFYMQL